MKYTAMTGTTLRMFSILETSVLDLWKPGKNPFVAVAVAFWEILGGFLRGKRSKNFFFRKLSYGIILWCLRVILSYCSSETHTGKVLNLALKGFWTCAISAILPLWRPLTGL